LNGVPNLAIEVAFMTNTAARNDVLRPQYDVAIIGMGPVGATLANLLALRDLHVLIVDREPDIYALPRAVQFDGECMRVFQTIGIADDMAPDLLTVPGMRFVDSNGTIIVDWTRPTGLGPHGWPASYRFHQPNLEAALRRRLGQHDNVDLRLRHDVFSLEQQADHVRLRLENTAAGKLLTTTASYVVGCDGARSTVRRFMGTELEDLQSHDRWLVLDLLLNHELPRLGDYAIQYCDSENPATYIRGIGSRRRWELMLPKTFDISVLRRQEEVWALLEKWITPEEAQIERSAVYTFHSVLAAGWRAGRLLIAGDAAHQTPPFMGQGMCAGIRDASNLAWKLADVVAGAADERLLDTYESERSPHVRIFIEEAVRLGRIIRDTERAVVAGGDAVERREQEKFVTPQPRLGPGAHDGSTHAGHVSTQPRLGDGRRLDDVAGYHAVLLVAPRFFELARARRDLVVVAADSEASRGYLKQLEAEAVLIRPDRYIYGTASRTDELERMLDGFGAAGRMANVGLRKDADRGQDP
jgi:3-(3-hydroxy-phenyl)propionate hydroxylase